MTKQAVSEPAEGDSALRKWRIGKGEKLEEVAAKLEISVATLSRIETRITKRLDPDLVDRITKLTGLSYRQIVA